LKTYHSVFYFGFEVSIHDLDLGGADRSIKGPTIWGGNCSDFRDRFTPSFNSKLFGDINEVLGFMVDRILLDIPGVHKDGGDIGFHSKFFPQGINILNDRFRDLVPVAG
jgi:hypothetical protein